MKVIIPAAGYATRLYPLTQNRPKALLEIKGKPILEHIVARVEDLPDISNIYVVSNDKYFKNFDDWAKGFESRIPVKILNDGTTSNENRKGQVGDIQFVIEQEGLDDDLLIIAGDNLFNFGLLPVFQFFNEKRTIVNALWDCQNLEVARQQGIAIIDQDKKLVDFQEKDPNPKSTLTSLGIYFFPKEKVSLFKQFIEGGNDADKMGYFMIWLIQNSEIFGHVYLEKWFDIGWHAALQRCREEFEP